MCDVMLFHYLFSWSMGHFDCREHPIRSAFAVCVKSGTTALELLMYCCNFDSEYYKGLEKVH